MLCEIWGRQALEVKQEYGPAEKGDPADAVLAGLASEAGGPLTELLRGEIAGVAMRRMTEGERLLLHLYFFENLSMGEIGKVLGRPESFVCTRIGMLLKFARHNLESAGIPRHLP